MLRKKISVLILVLSFFLFSYGLSFGEIRVFFSPKGGIAEEIIRQIDNAQGYIDIAMYSFTYQPIAEAVVEAKHRGVKIRVLMDRVQAQIRSSQYKYLLDNGIAVAQDRHAGIMHNKIAIIDGKVLFVGSYNWSESAEESNQENLLMFVDDEKIAGEVEEEIIRLYQERLDYLWDFNKSDP